MKTKQATWTCPHCGRVYDEYDEIDGPPCPSDDCPSHEGEERAEMHPSNDMFQPLIGKTVSAVQYVDDFGEGITLQFTDGSFLCVTEEMQAGRLQVSASIVMDEF